MAKIKRMLALLLCAVMLFSVMPLQGFAIGASDELLTEESVGGVQTGEIDVSAEDNLGELPDAELEPVVLAEGDAEVLAEGEILVPTAETGAVKVEHNGETTYYANLQKAFDGFAPKNNTYGGTYVVTLLDDVSGNLNKVLSYPTAILDITLDLNGHTITGDGTTIAVVFNLGSNQAKGSTVTITDTAGGGKITGGKGGVKLDGKDCTLNFQGGTITGNHGASKGGGILVGATSFLNMTGGVITGNSVTGTSSANTGYGGGVLANYASITGGAIYGNTAYKGSHLQTGRGGGVCTEVTRTTGYNTLTIADGVVFGNSAENAGDDLMAQGNGNVKFSLSIGTENWYVDGWKGTKAGSGGGQTDRYEEGNPVAYTDGGFTDVKNVTVGLKYVVPTEPEEPEAPRLPNHNDQHLFSVFCKNDHGEYVSSQYAIHVDPEMMEISEPVLNEEKNRWECVVTANIKDCIDVAIAYFDTEMAANNVKHSIVSENVPETLDYPMYWDDTWGWMLTSWTAPDDYYVICAPATCTITYTDGVEGEEVFADQSYTVEAGSATPTFEGTPSRTGYTFAGWDPEVAKTVTSDATYTATWEKAYVARLESTGEKFSTLQEALNAAKALMVDADNEAQTVTLINNTTEDVTTSFTTAAMTANNFLLTVDLNGYTVTGTGTKPVMTFGRTGNGGANYKMVVTINDSSEEKTGTVTGGNTASGGAIKMDGTKFKSNDELVINGGNFVNNTATSNGGAIYAISTSLDIIINGGTFTGNTAKSGGAISAYNVTVNGGVITGNTATGDAKFTGRGGGVHIWGTTTHLTVTGGQIYGNTASRYGDDIVYASTSSAAASSPAMSLINAANMSAEGVNAWLVDGYQGLASNELGMTDRFNAENPVEFTDYADFSGKEARGNAVALKAAAKPLPEYTVTYTDGIEDVELFADQTYTVKEGEATPAFNGEPTREGYTFGGWDPEVAETVTGNATYTAVWVPNSPDKYGKNVTSALVRVICDTDEDHAPMDIKWQHQSTKVRTWVSGVVWSEEENTWVVPVRIDSVSVYYVWMNYEKAYNDILHDLVDEENQSCIDTYLKWDEAKQLWVTMDGKPIEVHVTCKTQPDAPVYSRIKSFQIKVVGDLDGDGIYGENGLVNESGIFEQNTTSIPEEYYKNLVVKGNRKDGFTVDVSIPLVNGDIFINNWIEKRAPGEEYFYNWDKTPETVTFTLKYTGDLDGNLYGTRSGDWVLTTTGKYFGDVGTAYVGKEVTVTYTDGVENAEIFADQVYTVVDGSNTPAFEGTPARTGYDFAGWNPEVTETVSGETVYTATWTPCAPIQSNVTDKLVAIICDSDPDRHETVYGKWYPQHCNVLHDAEIVWDEELGTWTVDVKIGALYIMYVDQLEDANYGTEHTLVEDITTVYTTLKWDAEQELWVPVEDIELHTTCQTAPTAPTHFQLESYQIKVYGLVDGVEKAWTTCIPEGSYVVGEVKGSREEGFTVDVTVTIQDGDLFFTNWVDNRAPGEDYVYNWDKTPETVTFTLTYNGSLYGTLHGDRHASNTNYDWIIGFNYKNEPLIWGVVGEAYVGQEATVTYTDGVEDAVIFEDQVTDTFIGEATPAFEGEPVREHYTFAGWTPEVVDVVEGTVTYTATWEPVSYTVSFYPVDSDETSAELEVTYGESLEDSETELPTLDETYAGTVEGHTATYWYYVDAEGNEVVFDETTVVEGDMKVYAKFEANTYTVTLDAGEGELDEETVEVTYGEAIGELPVPTREGYTFEGWLDVEGNLVTAETVYNSSADAVFTASWKVVEEAPVDPEQPETGDNFMVVAVVIVMLVGAAGIALLVLNRKKFFNK